MTQHQKIIHYCRTHDGITVREAGIDLGVYCLHKRISELKEQGYVFDEPWEERDGKRWVRHRLIGEPLRTCQHLYTIRRSIKFLECERCGDKLPTRQDEEDMPTVQMELVS